MTVPRGTCNFSRSNGRGVNIPRVTVTFEA